MLEALLPSLAESVILIRQDRGQRHFEIIPIVRSHVSTSSGHLVIGYFVRRSPKACLPSAYKCISTGTPAFFSAM